jgi:hypothetical protein
MNYILSGINFQQRFPSLLGRGQGRGPRQLFSIEETSQRKFLTEKDKHKMEKAERTTSDAGI